MTLIAVHIFLPTLLVSFNLFFCLKFPKMFVINVNICVESFTYVVKNLYQQGHSHTHIKTHTYNHIHTNIYTHILTQTHTHTHRQAYFDGL